jgi:hypothetical protein
MQTRLTLRDMEHLPDDYMDVLPDTPKDRYFEALLEVERLAKKMRRHARFAMANVSGQGGRDPLALAVASKLTSLTGKMARALALAAAEVDRPANAA